MGARGVCASVRNDAVDLLGKRMPLKIVIGIVRMTIGNGWVMTTMTQDVIKK